MANSGRVVCVAISLALTLSSLIAMLVATLAGVAREDLYLFQIKATGNFFFSPSGHADLVGFCSPKTAGFKTQGLLNEIDDTCLRPNRRTIRFNAADIGIHAVYDVSLWGYCHTPQNRSRVCSEPTLNWAEVALNVAMRNVEDRINATGRNITLPERFTDMIRKFSVWTLLAEVFSVIAVMALSVELFFGIFATRSRVVSCATFLVACVATVAVCITVCVATFMLVVSAFSMDFGVNPSRCFLALPIGAVFAIAASVSWLFTICCCAPDNGRRRRGRDGKSEKLIPSGSYQLGGRTFRTPLQVQHPALESSARLRRPVKVEDKSS